MKTFPALTNFSKRRNRCQFIFLFGGNQFLTKLRFLFVGLGFCLSVLSQTQTICGNQATPAGWIITGYSSPCSGSTLLSKVITKIDGLPAGSTVRMCSLDAVPAGWVVISYDSPCTFSTSLSRVIKKVDGLAPGSTVRMCSLDAVPAGWIVSGYDSPCTFSTALSRIITRVDGLAPGATIRMCSLDAVPVGWVVVGYDSPCTFSTALSRLIKNLAGLPVGTTIRMCSLDAVPAGWVVTGYDSPCTFSSTQSRIIKKISGNDCLRYRDADGDGYGNASSTTSSCTASGYVSNSSDCNDSDGSVYPGAPEVCDGKDNNCNGQVDEGVQSTFYRDVDGDGYGGTTKVSACSAPAGYVIKSGDCDDNNGSVYPGAPELCDGKDNNCNGQVDEGVKSTFYRDADGDTYGGTITTTGCTAPAGYVSRGGDCNDANPAIHPGLTNSTEGWTQKANLPGLQRFGAVGFSIGNKVYLGTGEDGNNHFLKDFWEYDPTTNTWTQKADFGGTARYMAVGFSIGGKGYIGTGHDNMGHVKDFWEYNPSTNAWTRKADFAGGEGFGYFGMSIGSKGYIGSDQFWEYDPSVNTWTRKADAGGGGRGSAATFSIGNKGYVGLGADGSGKDRKDFWEYTPSTNTWTQKADFNVATEWAVGFSIGNKGYISSGWGFWEYDPSSNSWTSKPDLPGSHLNGVGCAIGTKGYVSTGRGSTFYKDMWEYKTATDTEPCNGVDDNCNGQIDEGCNTGAAKVITSEKTEQDIGVSSRKRGNKQGIIQDLTVEVIPNPTMHHFTLITRSDYDKPLQLRVIDDAGQTVEIMNGLAANGTYQLGHKYRTGIYFLDVRQGSQRVTVKLIKQTN